jgi:predicted nucleic acid-binding protein
MERLLLDTNIYGFIVVDADRESIHKAIHANKDISLYGFKVVRKELRSTKRSVINMNLRMNLLRVYDELIKKSYELTPVMNELAEQYYKLYVEIGGTSPKSKLMNDLLIIACASLKNLGIVVSNDKKTMLSELAIKAYTSVNGINKIKLPNFISYGEFKNVIKP